MEKAVVEEKRRKAALAESRKRPSSAIEPLENKRIKLDNDASSQTTSAAFLSAFDFTSLPAPLITNLIVANLEAFTEAQLIAFVDAYRQSRGMPIPSAALQTVAVPTPVASTSTAGPSVLTLRSVSQDAQEPALVLSEIKEEAIDPLKMDIDEEEMEYEPERLNEEVCSTVMSSDEQFFMPLPLCSWREHQKQKTMPWPQKSFLKQST